MDTREKYRNAIVEVLEGHIPRTPQSDIEVSLVTDDRNGHYQVVHSGWRNSGYTFGCVLHIDLTSDCEVIVKHNGTEAMIGDDLFQAGIPKEKITFAYLSKHAQAASGFGS